MRRAAPLSQAWLLLHTIRVRLTLWYVALLAVILVTFSTFLYSNLSHTLHQGIDDALATQAQQVLRTLDDNQPTLAEAADQIAPDMLITLYDRTGRKLLSGAEYQMVPDSTAARVAGAQGQKTLQTIILAGGPEARVLTVPLMTNGRASAVLQVVRPERDVAAALQKLLLLMAGAIPLTLLCAVAGGLFLAGRALNPIDRIRDTAARIEADDLSQRINFQGSPDEVGRLAATFDHMLARLEGAFQRQRQFTADASHELRTPLAILTSQVDIALERPRSADQYRDLLISVRGDVTRMDELLSQMLMLARADAGQSSLICERLSLTDLTADTVRAMEPLAEGRGVYLVHARPVDEMTIDGDQTRLTQLLLNLIDNGLKYTLPGGKVQVVARREGKLAVIKVVDSGVGIAPEHLPHVFERFYRIGPARARGEGGTGLGLPISQWIVQAHGGEIAVMSTPGHGTTFIVHLPLADVGDMDSMRRYSSSIHVPLIATDEDARAINGRGVRSEHNHSEHRKA